MRRVVKIVAVVAVFALLLVGGGAVWIYSASQQVPAFYDEAVAVKPKDQTGERDSFVARAAALASDLQSDGQWHSLFTADEINAWLALELAANYPDLLPAELCDPRISLSNGEATIGCRYHSGELETVVSITLEPYLQEPNVVALRVRRARAGALPVPLGHILDGISRAAQQLNLRLEWRHSHGTPVALVTLPPAGDGKSPAARLDSIELRDGELFVSGRAGHPEPPSASPVVPEPLLVPTASNTPRDDDGPPGSDDQPRVGSLETENETVHK